MSRARADWSRLTGASGIEACREITSALPDVKVFHAGTAIRDGQVITNGEMPLRYELTNGPRALKRTA